MILRFFGATGGTTGTCHMIRSGGRTVLFDCGLFQGRREESHRRNARFPFQAGSIDAVVQSHAHIDHSGKLPMLVRHGYRGPIHSTPATRDLCRILLHDCARILLQDAQYLNRQRMREKLRKTRRSPGRSRRGRRKPADGADADGHEEGDDPQAALLLPRQEVLPLYLEEDVEETLPLFRTHAYGAWFEPVPGVRARFHDAGHILGSAWIEAEFQERGRKVRVVFTGDYGRQGQPILRDPEPLVPCDVLLTESTYGNRAHERERAPGEGLADAVRRLAARGRGRLLIPAFAIGRTQNLLYELSRLYHAKAVPAVDVVVDSPLATRATRIVLDHPELFDAEALAEFRRFGAAESFRSHLRFTESVDESKAVNADPRPLIVISASGMCESGRILHHLAWHVGSADTEILIVGFQAQHTLGRRLLEGREEVRIFGQMRPVHARVTSMLGYSAHADREELLAALAPLAGHDPRVFLLHGEDPARAALETDLRGRGFTRIEKPADSSPWTV